MSINLLPPHSPRLFLIMLVSVYLVFVIPVLLVSSFCVMSPLQFPVFPPVSPDSMVCWYVYLFLSIYRLVSLNYMEIITFFF